MAIAYRTDPATEAYVTSVETDDGRHFLVIRFRIREWKTLVFQHGLGPDCWISRREIFQNMDPTLAVTGLLFGAPQPLDPIASLKRELDRAHKANWDLRGQLSRIRKTSARKPGERGKRAR